MLFPFVLFLSAVNANYDVNYNIFYLLLLLVLLSNNQQFSCVCFRTEGTLRRLSTVEIRNSSTSSGCGKK